MVISEVRACKKNKNRVNVYIEGEYAFSCYAETAIKNHLKKDEEIDPANVDEIVMEDGNQFAMQTALQYVSAKPRTQKEVEDRLRRKEIADDHIAFAVDKLYEYDYLDDAEYADALARELAAKYGGQVICQKLMQRGIDREAAREAAARYSTEDALRGQYEKLRTRYAGEEPQKRRQKMIRALLAKGFAYDEIKHMMGGRDEE